jgi:poly(3-hydroxybutyrate) depolymerase
MGVFETAVVARPFCTLRAIERERSRGPAVLIVTPVSGQRVAIFGDLTEALAPDHEVYVTDWVDAALVSRTQGGFDLDDMIGYIFDFVGLLGSGVHLIGMSQSGVPLLAATALMAAGDNPARPRSLTIMGGLIDTRINPTPMNRVARRLLADPALAYRLQQRLIRPVPAGMPGAGRLVYPGAVQRAALKIYLLRRISPGSPTPLHVFQNVLVGDGEPSTARRKLYRDFLSPMSVPAELYLQTVRTLFGDDALAAGSMRWRGTPVDPAAIRDTGLMTVEGGRDDISGHGQTRVAHDLCLQIPPGRRLHHDEPDVGHLGMFHGRRWRGSILPRLRRFLRDNARRGTG